VNGKINKQASEKVEKFRIKYRRSVNVALQLNQQRAKIIGNEMGI